MNTWDDAFTQRNKLAASTQAPMNVEDSDLPPGAPPYAGGPLANPKPQPTPRPNMSLSALAAGGMNHAQIWMSGQAAAPVFQQQPFSPQTNSQPNKGPDMSHLSWSSAF